MCKELKENGLVVFTKEEVEKRIEGYYNGLSGETKICKCCGKEKPVEEFSEKSSKCRVCNYFKNKNNKYKIINGWSLDEYIVILDIILNKKLIVCNGIEHFLNNKSIKQLADILSSNLKIRNAGIKYEVICNNCFEHFIIPIAKYTSNKFKYCSQKCSFKAQNKKVTITCKNCGKEKTTSPSCIKKGKNNFCGHKCADLYNSKQKENRVKKICEQCGEEYNIIFSRKDSSMFCSNECRKNWLKINAPRNKNHHQYTRKQINCSICGKKFERKLSRIKDDRNFCSEKCFREWYANDFSQQEEWKEERRKTILKNYENGKFEHTKTKPQLVIESILNKNNIEFTREKSFDFYSVDIYLKDYNLIIEVQGDYWHCNNKKYNTINYKNQLKKIRSDKSKSTFILNNYNINVLYLWENDIMNNAVLCESIINMYIDNNGILENYHSFNYSIVENSLFINKNIIKPYMEWDSKDIDNIIDLNLKSKISKKDESKWIKYNCENCGKECEELISHYSKKKTHCCSKECSIQLRYYKTKTS